MHLEGSFESLASPKIVWEFLMNPNEIAPCFPDLQSLEVLTPDSFKAKVKVGLSVVRGTMDLEFTIADKIPNTSAKLIGTGRGVGSTLALQTAFTLTGSGSGTRVTWVADAKISGVMAGLGTKLIDSASQKMVTQVLETLEEKLKAKTGTT
jgi:carbon monoxide dehydrogenase subunit G